MKGPLRLAPLLVGIALLFGLATSAGKGVRGAWLETDIRSRMLERRQTEALSSSPQITTSEIEVDGERLTQTVTVTETALGLLTETCLSPLGVDVDVAAAGTTIVRSCVIWIETNDTGQGGGTATLESGTLKAVSAASTGLSAPSSLVVASTLSSSTTTDSLTGSTVVTVAPSSLDFPSASLHATVTVAPVAPTASISLIKAPFGTTSPSGDVDSTIETDPTSTITNGRITEAATSGIVAASSTSGPWSSAPPSMTTSTSAASTHDSSTAVAAVGASSLSDILVPLAASGPDLPASTTAPSSLSGFTTSTTLAPTTLLTVTMSDPTVSLSLAGSTEKGTSPSSSSPSDVALLSGVFSESASTATSSAAAATASTFSMPGTQLQVLPVGLGVFSAVSVIALGVVGIVTYERRKYRRMFRGRRDAEKAERNAQGNLAHDDHPAGFVPAR